jgi:hypothetical protein
MPEEMIQLAITTTKLENRRLGGTARRKDLRNGTFIPSSFPCAIPPPNPLQSEAQVVAESELEGQRVPATPAPMSSSMSTPSSRRADMVFVSCRQRCRRESHTLNSFPKISDGEKNTRGHRRTSCTGRPSTAPSRAAAHPVESFSTSGPRAHAHSDSAEHTSTRATGTRGRCIPEQA